MADNMLKTLGERIKKARERLNISQTELAVRCGFRAHQTISVIEKGEREVKAWELAALAKALSVDMHDLLMAEELKENPAVLWRQRPQKNSEIIEADFINHCKQYAMLEKIIGETTTHKLLECKPNGSTFNYDTAKELATTVGKELDLGSCPAASLVGTLENRFGVKIWYADLKDEGSAAAIKGEFGLAILINTGEAPWRRNFSLAHELFHLLTWDIFPPASFNEQDSIQDTKIESFANTFASNLLLPADELVNTCSKYTKNGKMAYVDFVSVAREFRVSTEALMYRLKGLGYMTQKNIDTIKSDPEFIEEDKRSMKGNWPASSDLSERYVRLAFKAYKKGKISRAKLAEYLNTSLFDLTDKLLEYGLDDRERYEAEVPIARR